MTDYYVEIAELDTEEVVKRMGPMSEMESGKVAREAMTNLNFDKYWIKISHVGTEEVGR